MDYYCNFYRWKYFSIFLSAGLDFLIFPPLIFQITSWAHEIDIGDFHELTTIVSQLKFHLGLPNIQL